MQAHAQVLQSPRRRSDQSTGTSCSCKISSPASVRRTGRTGSRRAASCVQPSPRPAGRAWPPVMRISCPTLAAMCQTILGEACGIRLPPHPSLHRTRFCAALCGRPHPQQILVSTMSMQVHAVWALVKAIFWAQDIWLWWRKAACWLPCGPSSSTHAARHAASHKGVWTCSSSSGGGSGSRQAAQSDLHSSGTPGPGGI